MHVIKYPLTEYLHFEFASYLQSIQQGENILLLHWSEYEKSGLSITKDFWLFDDKIVLLMNYDSQGRFKNYTVITEGISTYITAKNHLLELAKPFDATQPL